MASLYRLHEMAFEQDDAKAAQAQVSTLSGVLSVPTYL